MRSKQEPPHHSDTQRRCWTITDSVGGSYTQCWLFNGHSGEHTFAEVRQLRSHPKLNRHWLEAAVADAVRRRGDFIGVDAWVAAITEGYYSRSHDE